MINMSLTKNNKGFTLVEVLAAIVIMTIIITSVISILNLTAKTNRTSKEIIDATYVAQQEMERIYKLSEEGSQLKNFYSERGLDSSGEWKVYEKPQEPYVLVIKEQAVEDGLVRIVVTVYDAESNEERKVQATMESLLKWGAEANEPSPK